jgi:cytoskeletal protein RodZ
MNEDIEDRPLRSRQKISFFRRLVLRIRFLSKVQLLIIIVILLFITVGGIFIFHSFKASNQNTNVPSITPTLVPSDSPSDTPSQPSTAPSTDSPSSSDEQTTTANISPTITCIGPDGKTLYVTQQQCDAFNGAWATPTPTVIPTTPTDTPTISPIDTPTPTDSPTPTPGA